MLNIAH